MKTEEFQKMSRGLGTSGTTLSALKSKIIGVPEGEEKEQEIENLYEQIMKKTSPVCLKK